MIVKPIGLSAVFAVACLGVHAEESAQPTQQTVYDEGKSYVLQDRLIYFHTHPGTIWDDPSTCRDGIRNFDRILDARYAWRDPKNPPPTRLMFMSDPENDNGYFLTKADVTSVVRSNGGAHNFSFPKVEEFVFSGGYLELCLCESVRDAVKGTETEKRDFTKQPLKMTFITDAIYRTAVQDGAGIPVDKVRTSDDNLALAIHYLSNENFVKNLSRFIFNVGENKFCFQTHTNKFGKDKDPKMSDYTVTVVKNETEIGTIGTGKQRIRATFMTSEEYAAALNKR